MDALKLGVRPSFLPGPEVIQASPTVLQCMSVAACRLRNVIEEVAMRSLGSRSALCLAAPVLACCLASCSSESPQSIGALSGHVSDVVSSRPVAGVDVSAGDASATTDSQGYFFLTVESGASTIRVVDEDYVTFESSISVEEGEHDEIDFALFPLPVTRFVLTWGDQPANLDAHAWVPMGTGTYDHIWSGDYGDADRPPYTILDCDVTTGDGPEVVYIRPGLGNYYQGWYHFAVQHTAGDLSLPGSEARVDIYRGNQLRQTIEPPPGSADSGWYWYVGRLNCQTMEWVEIGTYSAEAPLPDAGQATPVDEGSALCPD